MKARIKNLFLLPRLIASFILMLMTAPTVIQAQFSYAVNPGNTSVTITAGPGGDVVIPSTLGGLPVTGIGSGFYPAFTSATSIEIPNTVTTLNYGAFADANLTGLTIPSSVTYIAAGEFTLCSGLTSLCFQGSPPQLGGNLGAFYVGVIYYNSEATGWGSSFGGVPTAPCSQCGTGGQLLYAITVSASPANGGTVSGGGTFASGSSQTVTATANSGYTFTNWTENGSVVNTSASYTFMLNGNESLVANFTAVTNTVTIIGNVFGNCAGLPLFGASVQIGTYSTTSGSDGSYSISGIPSGTYTVMVTANNYVNFTNTVTIPSSVQTVTNNFALSPLPGLVPLRVSIPLANVSASDAIDAPIVPVTDPNVLSTAAPLGMGVVADDVTPVLFQFTGAPTNYTITITNNASAYKNGTLAGHFSVLQGGIWNTNITSLTSSSFANG